MHYIHQNKVKDTKISNKFAQIQLPCNQAQETLKNMKRIMVRKYKILLTWEYNINKLKNRFNKKWLKIMKYT